MGLIDRRETWVNNFHCIPRYIPEVRRTQLHRCGSLLSRNRVWNLAWRHIWRFRLLFFSYVENRGKKEAVILKCFDFSFATFVRSILGLIVVIRHELGLKRPVSASSYSLFKGLPNQFTFVRVVNNSVFILALCCSFLLQVVASLFCIFVISRQLVLLSNSPEFLWWSKRVYPAFLLKKKFFLV